LVFSREDLNDLLANWEQPELDIPEHKTSEENGRDPEAPPPPGHPVGLVILMEGAEGVCAPAELEEWWVLGVRLIGPAGLERASVAAPESQARSPGKVSPC